MKKNLIVEIYKVDAELNEKLQQAKTLTIKRKNTKNISKEIWELSKKKFVLKSNLNPELQKYEGLIFTVGMRLQPKILNILANKPKSVYFIYTQGSKSSFDSILEETELEFSQYIKQFIALDSTEKVFNLIQGAINFCTERTLTSSSIKAE